MSSVRLFVLGLVYEHDTHGYEIKEVARLWGVEGWASIAFGSIYHALGKLQEEGMIEERNIEREGSHPPRFIYRITGQGQSAFLEMLRETCRSAGTERRDIDIALAFIPNLPPEERVALLSQRQAMLEESLASLRRGFASLHEQKIIPWVTASVRHSEERIKWEIAWNRSLIAEVKDWPRREWSR